MRDLTKIREPFGLLDKETQLALKAHGGPYEVFCHNGTWDTRTETEVSWLLPYVYRAKSEPPKPREWWIVFEDESFFHSAHTNEADAIDAADAAELTYLKIIHVREVI